MIDVILAQLDRTDSSEKRLYTLLSLLDYSFIPPLNSVTNISAYCAKLIQFAEVIVAIYLKEDIGLIAIYANDEQERCAFITSIGVKPEFHGKGIGRILLQRGIQVAHEKGMQRVHLEVNLENQAALKLYHKAGFIEIKRPIETSAILELTIDSND
jgi:ribosomal protein S18 acetylase RimI-like enzyme